MARTLDFYFFVGSTYSYLSVSRAAREAAKAGVTLNWLPFSVRTLMREQNNSPFAGKPVKMAYMWRDLERRAARFGVPFDGAPPYPIDPQEKANRMATLASMQGWCPAFVQAAYEAWFIRKLDPGVPEHLRAILQGLGRDADACLAQADSEPVAALYAQRTNAARALGLFGSPSYVAGTEVFWGDDRLEDALAWVADEGPRR
jgi:2-hydroxychromene-2-carboxylate isomerase